MCRLISSHGVMPHFPGEAVKLDKRQRAAFQALRPREVLELLASQLRVRCDAEGKPGLRDCLVPVLRILDEQIAMRAWAPPSLPPSFWIVPFLLCCGCSLLSYCARVLARFGLCFNMYCAGHNSGQGLCTRTFVSTLPRCLAGRCCKQPCLIPQ